MKMLKMVFAMGLVAVVPMAQAEVTIAPSVTLNAASQIPSDESLQKLVEVMNFDKNLNQHFSQNKEMAKLVVIQMFKDNQGMKNLSAEQQQQFEQAAAEFMEKIANEQNQPELRQQMKNVYMETAKTTYTQEEVNALIAFHSSKVGQSILSKQSKFIEISNQKMLPIALNSQQKIMQKLMPEMQQKFDKILKPTSKAKKNVKSK